METYEKAKTLFSLMNPVELGCYVEGLDSKALTTKARKTVSAKWRYRLESFSPKIREELALHFPFAMLSDQAIDALQSLATAQAGPNKIADDMLSLLIQWHDEPRVKDYNFIRDEKIRMFKKRLPYGEKKVDTR